MYSFSPQVVGKLQGAQLLMFSLSPGKEAFCRTWDRLAGIRVLPNAAQDHVADPAPLLFNHLLLKQSL